MKTIESKVSSYSKTFKVNFKKAKGTILTDKIGKEYLDFFTGAGTMNYGHNNKVSNQAMIDYLSEDNMLHSLDLDTDAKIEFINTIDNVILKPRGLDYKVQLVSPSGTNSVEAAFKLARKFTQRRKIMAFGGGFHGMSLGSLGATANKYYKSEVFPSTDVQHMPFENYMEGLDSIKFLRKTLTDSVSGIEIPAAIILETIQADGGVNVASNTFLQELRAICDEFDILLIADDIQVGNGRSSDFFSFERANIIPDIVCISKGIGGGMPLSIVLFKPELDIWKTGEHSGTFRGNNLSFVSGTSVIKEYWSNNKFSDSIKEKAIIIEDFLRDNLTDYTIDIRGYGLIWGLELTPEKALELRTKCFENGLMLELVGAEDNVAKLMPPLTITNEELLNGLEILKTTLKGL